MLAPIPQIIPIPFSWGGQQPLSQYPNRPLTDAEIPNYISDLWLNILISNSSYFRKYVPNIDAISLDRNARIALYRQCRNYATTNIVDSLYPVDKLREPVTHLDCGKDKFYILTRVRTNREKPTIEETAATQRFLAYSLVNQDNLSHFPGNVWYGYRKGITSSMIGYISPSDADTHACARNRLELSERYEQLLDAEDLMNESLKTRSYTQLSVETNSTVCSQSAPRHIPVTPDCILCIGHIDALSRQTASARGLPILVLHPAKNTYRNVKDYYPTPELANPIYR